VSHQRWAPVRAASAARAGVEQLISQSDSSTESETVSPDPRQTRTLQLLRPTESSDRTTPVSGRCSKVQQRERAPMRLAGATVRFKTSEIEGENAQ